MKARFLLLAAAGMFLYHPYAAAQLYSPAISGVNEVVMESLVGMDTDPEEANAQLREIEILAENPVNLNTAGKEELQKIPFLTDFQIVSLLEYRKTNGNLISLNELQVIHGFTEELIQMILPFVTTGEHDVTIKSQSATSGVFHEIELYSQRNIQKARGYEKFDSLSGKYCYPGSPWMISGHYRAKIRKNLEAGVTVEKDAGEEFFSGSNHNGFDFYSGYIMLEKTGMMKTLVAGDYRLSFGQGLTLWHGASPGKSSMPMSVVKRQDAVKPYRSNDENNFFRGLAATAEYRNFMLTLFYSSRPVDANITDTISGKIHFSSFQETGYHRTCAETYDERSVHVNVMGGNLIYRSNHFKLGTTLVNYHFNKFLDRGDDLRNIHDFNGQHLLNFGVDYLLTFSKIQFFGETSLGNKHWASVNGILLPVNKYASISFIYRKYAPGYYSLHSAAFSESSSDSNEEGFYAGLVIHPMAKVKISCYADFYKFPWLRYRLSAPASGSDYLIQADYSPSKHTEMYLRFKYESRPVDNPDLPDNAILPEISEQETSGIRYHISYNPASNLVMQNRIEVSFVEHAKGILVFQDIQYKLLEMPLHLDARLTWFNTGDYQTRIYAYEQDMRRGYSFTPLYDSGFRFYVMANYALKQKMVIAAKFSNTLYGHQKTTGTGYDEVTSSSKSEIKIMLTIRL